MTPRTPSGFVLSPTCARLDRQQQVADLALLHPDFPRAVREARNPMRGPQLGDVVGAEGDVVDVIRCRQSVFLGHYPQPQRAFFPLSSRRRARVKTDGFHTVSVDLRFSSVRCTKRPMQEVFSAVKMAIADRLLPPLFGVHVFLSSSHWVVTIVLIPRTVNSAPGGSSSPAFSGQ